MLCKVFDSQWLRMLFGAFISHSGKQPKVIVHLKLQIHFHG